jgi:hydrogenase-1 operon protein HyaF
MNQLNDIPVQVVLGNEDPNQVPPNVIALLHEITTHLGKLISDNQTEVIDLMGFLSDSEREALKHILGEGEVFVKLEALGESTLYETLIPGVWWISHTSIDNKHISENIEITRIPAILKSDELDIRDGIKALKDQLDELSSETNVIGEQEEDEQRQHAG